MDIQANALYFRFPPPAPFKSHLGSLSLSYDFPRCKIYKSEGTWGMERFSNNQILKHTNAGAYVRARNGLSKYSTRVPQKGLTLAQASMIPIGGQVPRLVARMGENEDDNPFGSDPNMYGYLGPMTDKTLNTDDGRGNGFSKTFQQQQEADRARANVGMSVPGVRTAHASTHMSDEEDYDSDATITHATLPGGTGARASPTLSPGLASESGSSESSAEFLPYPALEPHGVEPPPPLDGYAPQPQGIMNQAFTGPGGENPRSNLEAAVRPQYASRGQTAVDVPTEHEASQVEGTLESYAATQIIGNQAGHLALLRFRAILVVLRLRARELGNAAMSAVYRAGMHAATSLPGIFRWIAGSLNYLATDPEFHATVGRFLRGTQTAMQTGVLGMGAAGVAGAVGVAGSAMYSAYQNFANMPPWEGWQRDSYEVPNITSGGGGPGPGPDGDGGRVAAGGDGYNYGTAVGYAGFVAVLAFAYQCIKNRQGGMDVGRPDAPPAMQQVDRPSVLESGLGGRSGRGTNRRPSTDARALSRERQLFAAMPDPVALEQFIRNTNSDANEILRGADRARNSIRRRRK